jgi:hypothetical protein
MAYFVNSVNLLNLVNSAKASAFLGYPMLQCTWSMLALNQRLPPVKIPATFTLDPIQLVPQYTENKDRTIKRG